jgi:hypothetical protein
MLRRGGIPPRHKIPWCCCGGGGAHPPGLLLRRWGGGRPPRAPKGYCCCCAPWVPFKNDLNKYLGTCCPMVYCPRHTIENLTPIRVPINWHNPVALRAKHTICINQGQHFHPSITSGILLLFQWNNLCELCENTNHEKSIFLFAP